MTASLAGRVAIITGAGQGIGRVFAKAFAAAGAIPVIAERNGERGDAVAAEIAAAGGRARAITTDVARRRVRRRHGEGGRGGIRPHRHPDQQCRDLLHLEMRPFDQIPLAEWEAVLRVNVTGAFLCARAVVAAMRRAGFGRIINMASGAVTLGRPNYLHYITSKGGARRHDPVAGARARAAWDHRQRHPARRDLHRNRAQNREPGAKRANCRHAMHRAAGGTAGPGRNGPFPGVRRRFLPDRPSDHRGRRRHAP